MRTIKTVPMSEIKKVYWSISEVAEIINATPNTVRQWCKWFCVEVRKNKRNDRMFTEKNIVRLRVVYILLKVEQYSVRGAQRWLGVPITGSS